MLMTVAYIVTPVRLSVRPYVPKNDVRSGTLVRLIGT